MLRVLNGIGVISIERKTVWLTEMGKLKGRGLLKYHRKRERCYDEKKKELEKLIDRRR